MRSACNRILLSYAVLSQNRTLFSSKKLKEDKGLSNLGNTCYMNSVLQSLLNLPQFHEILKNLPSEKHKTEFIETLSKIATLKTEKQGISPVHLRNLLQNLGFKSFKQNDAHEFLQKLLALLAQDIEKMWLSKSPEKVNLLQKSFEGSLKYSFKCLNCQHTFEKIDPFKEILLPIPPKFHSFKKPIGIQELLESYFSNEEIEDYKCEKCLKKSRFVKQTRIHKLPEILVFAFNIFNVLGKEFIEKLEKKIEIPLEGLNLRNFETGKLGKTFSLDSFICHFGSSVDYGHYISVCKNRERNVWVKFDDENVQEIDLNSGQSSKKLSSSTFYLLFYISNEK